MSWDVRIVDEDGKVMQCKEPHLLRGGTVRCDEKFRQIPIHDARLNVTYNYSRHYKILGDDSLRSLDGKTTEEAIPLLVKGIQHLGTELDDDYWKSTPGNAGAVLESLLFLAFRCPGGRFAVD